VGAVPASDAFADTLIGIPYQLWHYACRISTPLLRS
jgi:hypothetical protein